MKHVVPFIKRALQTSAIAAVLMAGLGGCGGGDSGTAGGSAVVHASGSAAPVTSTQIVPPNATFQGRTYAQWEALSWQWALALPTAGHPFSDCTNRRISDDQTGNVWFWAAPTTKVTCDQSATIIPANTAIFLTTLDAEASSLEAPPFGANTYEDQLAIAKQFADYIQDDLFVIIDGKQVPNVKTYRFATAQFKFTAPTPWIFGDTGGKGTSVGDGYFYMLQLPPGPHTIHYGGTSKPPTGKPTKMDVTLFVTVGS